MNNFEPAYKGQMEWYLNFLFTWLKKKGIDDALIQPYSGHENRA
ncbi:MULTISPECIES: hypothetical protein [Legionella]|nr:hypothetical protein [Legionella maceachernii]SKA24498.1 hypothetical protein SAMN02745128_02781 [Legionella maceachernii]SUP04312.1 Uncharacterised protein [Legionella maceachernii]